MKINIIGDIAGRYDELLLLLKKMPEADLVIAVGDLVDRGPRSKDVLEHFMYEPNTLAIFGNHEEMMVDSVKYGNYRNWFYNGGLATAKSFGYKPGDRDVYIPSYFIDWLETRPTWFDSGDGLFVSHAPVPSLQHIPPDPLMRDYYFIWNRITPNKPLNSNIMIYGHNGEYLEHKDKDGKIYSICIDNSLRSKLTGLHWPTMEVFEQEYLDK